MQTTQRQHAALLIEPLLAAPYRYRFAQLLNILVRMLRQQGIPYARAFSQVLRFRNSLSLAFPASEIEGMQVDATDGAGTPRIHITPSFIGLLGASGTLPLHDTERAAAKANLGADESWKPFVDLFSNRVIGLFYEAWGKYRVEHSLDTRGQDDLLPLLSALGGLRLASFGAARSYASIPAEVAGYYAGLLRTRPIAASSVERVLGEYFGVPVRVEEFVGAWDAIPEKIRSTLGVTEPTLGFGAVLGARTWRNDLRVRLHIGPLDEETAKAFLSNGRSHGALKEMIRLFAVPSVQYEVRLLLAKPCLKPLTLATKGQDRRRLGLNSFLTVCEGKASRPDIRSVLRPKAAIRPAVHQ
jgi:type VI secretion system protein ImpH